MLSLKFRMTFVVAFHTSDQESPGNNDHATQSDIPRSLFPLGRWWAGSQTSRWGPVGFRDGCGIWGAPGVGKLLCSAARRSCAEDGWQSSGATQAFLRHLARALRMSRDFVARMGWRKAQSSVGEAQLQPHKSRELLLWFVALSQGAGSGGTLGVHRDGDKKQSGCLRCQPDLRDPLVPPGQRHQLLWLFPLWSCPLWLHRERGPSERQYKYHTSPLAS